MDVISYSKIKKVKAELDQNKQETQLKVLNVEKELKDYQKTLAQVNVNHEAKQSASGYGTISLPPNTANGQVSVGVKGITYTNLLGVAGDFEVDSNSNGVADGFLTIVASEKSLVPSFDGGKAQRLVGSGSEALTPRIAYRLPNKSNLKLGKYFVSIYVKCPNLTDVTLLSMYVRDVIGMGSTLSNRVNIPVAKLSTASFVRIGAVLEVTSLPINQADFKIVFNKTKANTVSEMQIDKMQIVYLNDLGETETDVDKLLQKYPYITNTKSTISASRLKSVRKNLFDGELEKGTILSAGNNNDNAENRIRSKNKIKIIPNVQYCLSNNKNYRDATLYFYDNNGNFITSEYKFEIPRIFTAPSNTHYVRFIIASTGADISTKVQLEKGDTPTEYEPYKESTAYVVAKDKDNKIVNLMSHEGVHDEIDLDKRELIKRIGVDEEGLTYQLAQEEIIPIEVSGNIVSDANGTVYIEHGTFTTGVYGTNGVVVTNTGLPIKTINKITKIDYVTGLEYDLDTSQATISEDKLLFTHPDLTTGDIVFFDYDYDLESTEGLTTVEFYDSRYVKEDKSITGKFYTWDIEIDNGVPSITVVEV